MHARSVEATGDASLLAVVSCAHEFRTRSLVWPSLGECGSGVKTSQGSLRPQQRISFASIAHVPTQSIRIRAHFRPTLWSKQLRPGLKPTQRKTKPAPIGSNLGSLCRVSSGRVLFEVD